jgi:hypothetical protein
MCWDQSRNKLRAEQESRISEEENMRAPEYLFGDKTEAFGKVCESAVRVKVFVCCDLGSDRKEVHNTKERKLAFGASSSKVAIATIKDISFFVSSGPGAGAVVVEAPLRGMTVTLRLISFWANNTMPDLLRTF